jgi:hypothetical protein
MLKHLAIFAVVAFVLAAAPSVQAAPAAGLLSMKSTQSVIQPVYWCHHRHYYRYWGPAHRRCGWGWLWW